MSKKLVHQALSLLDKKASDAEKPTEATKAPKGGKKTDGLRLGRLSGGVSKLKKKALKLERQRLEEKKKKEELKAMEEGLASDKKAKDSKRRKNLAYFLAETGTAKERELKAVLLQKMQT
ncbi:hypothetical protein M427DRAFT_138993 [Gonapodya prolifera JEL478]|uniref:Uncharacterized protein n=1 Tax=Gonapodya prolifera (strain JEL478) TaxID=1344416 RepID=A0A139A1R6_GONPJ|nr:hypothetical protein M427DRAFT_138993 [Gonapodya prolifera JEL478]|eukprot:KXS10726.1 hypothetical protein M427DRAFT_138993 [Gonapodya prolifera JEL478]